MCFSYFAGALWFQFILIRRQEQKMLPLHHDIDQNTSLWTCRWWWSCDTWQNFSATACTQQSWLGCSSLIATVFWSGVLHRTESVQSESLVGGTSVLRHGPKYTEGMYTSTRETRARVKFVLLVKAKVIIVDIFGWILRWAYHRNISFWKF